MALRGRMGRRRRGRSTDPVDLADGHSPEAVLLGGVGESSRLGAGAASLGAAVQGRSLRTRLTAVLVSLAAVGLIVLAAITYGSQKQFLDQRVDDQVGAAVRFVAPQVIRKTKAALDDGSLRPSSDGLSATVQSGALGGGNGGGPGGGLGAIIRPKDGNGPPKGSDDLPPGTYGELRTTTGTQVGQSVTVANVSDDQLPAPNLPDDLVPDETLTVDAVSGDGRYRVRTELNPMSLAADGSPTMTVAAIPLAGTEEQLQQLVLVDAIVILVILGLLGLAASKLVSVELSPLRHIATDADAIAAGELDRRVAEAAPGTEVGRLGVALNAMLGRIEESFAERQASEDRLRRFLSDASHELRTPLASIRGYAELQRTGMIATDEERMVAVSRIEEQAARMGTLVEDLLALARLDEERAPATDLVELAMLARDAVADAGSLDPTRELSLEVEGDPLVLGQEAKLRQVLTNLLGNAVAHTPEGTPIAVAVHTEGDFAVVDVDDTGLGIPAEARTKIFERFHREAGGSARTRGPAGAGLGLAVVRGIVEAHGGTVVVSDAPTGGARFRVRLPLVDTTDEPAE
ncbi:MAG: HAMP domain-containing sensor histidine kinase [Solirubrobacteraceae bacterium]|nr:HAMP domain-containing sensor histidine kinase [Solirubrobacteraceae bacterium]